jgi:hypothetical protein
MKSLYSPRSTVLAALILVLLGAGPTLAQQDPSIRNWGNPEGTPPPWQTPDIWVDNNGKGTDDPAGRDEVGEPSIGQSNNLFAQIRNLGPGAIDADILVRFAFAPYGVWTAASDADFKEIGSVTVHGLGAAGAMDAEKTVEINWDLSNLMEDNGGAWGGHTIGEFAHFCVLVTLSYGGDANMANNVAHNNFTNVPISGEAQQSVKFLIANPKATEAVAEMLIQGLPETWRSRLEGAEQGRFVLKAHEFRAVSLTFTPPKRSSDAAPLSAHVDVSLKLDGAVAGGLSILPLPAVARSPHISSGRTTSDRTARPPSRW